MADFPTHVTPRLGRYGRKGKWLVMAVQVMMAWHLIFATAAGAKAAAGSTGSGDSTGAAGEKSDKSDTSDKPNAPDPELVQQMLLEVRELRARVSDLEAKLAAERAPAQPEPAAASSSVMSSSSAMPAPAAPPPAAVPQDSSGNPPVGVKLRMFGDVGYGVSDIKGDHNSFHIGSLDLFLTGTLSDRVSVLGEVLFVPQKDNSIGTDVERLLLQYKHNDHLTAAVGRYHTSIGYYNTAFHQGSWFQTAVDRPFMYAFDDHGGFLPLQDVGLTTSGSIPSGKFGLHYVAEVGNGRAHLIGSDPAQNTHDTNNGKSVNFALSAHPAWVSGLEAAFSIYHDHLTFSDNLNHSELITTAWVVYNNSKWEFLNEAMLVRHTFASLEHRAYFTPRDFIR